MALQVFVADVAVPVLSDEDQAHLSRALRLRPGDEVLVADGCGRRCMARLGRAGEVEVVGPITTVLRPTPEITVAFAVTKGGRPEWAVQKLTELGADRIIMFLAARSVVRWDGDRAERHVARLRKVAREAAMQCGRSWLPTMPDLASFHEVAASAGAALADPGGRPPSLAYPTVLIGPEGGWDDRERSSGLRTVGLGQEILRAETAAMTATALLGALRSNLVLESDLSSA